MAKKMVVFDIDGTLVDDEKRLPEETKEAIIQLQNNDVYVAIATGRPPFLFEDLRKELNIQSYISFNGQHVVFEGEVIYENPIEEDELSSLHKALQEYGIPMVYMNDVHMRATVDNNPYIRKCFEKIMNEYPKVDLEFHLNTPVHQALLFCKEGEEQMIVDQYPVFNFLRWHEYSLDILPPGGSKAVGIQKLIEASGLHEVDTYAFGDGSNDIEMIQEIGTGIAMGNAIPQLKKVADFITTDVDRRGIVNALEHFKLL